jgi:hypothetical protein
MMTDHKDIRLEGWGKEVDYNLFPDVSALEKARENGTDARSGYGDPLFIDPKHADFSVGENSPALELGFKNFPMDQFGVQKPAFKILAKTPEIPELIFPAGSGNTIKTTEWLGSTLKNVETMGERSAAGLKEVNGVLITKVNNNSLSKSAGLQEGDVIIHCEDKKIQHITDLLNTFQGNNWKGMLSLTVVRNQQEKSISIRTK